MSCRCRWGRSHLSCELKLFLPELSASEGEAANRLDLETVNGGVKGSQLAPGSNLRRPSPTPYETFQTRLQGFWSAKHRYFNGFVFFDYAPAGVSDFLA